MKITLRKIVMIVAEQNILNNNQKSKQHKSENIKETRGGNKSKREINKYMKVKVGEQNYKKRWKELVGEKVKKEEN